MELANWISLETLINNFSFNNNMLLLLIFLLMLHFSTIYGTVEELFIPIELYSIPGHGWHKLSLSSTPRFYYVVLVAMWRGCFVKRARAYTRIYRARAYFWERWRPRSVLFEEDISSFSGEQTARRVHVYRRPYRDCETVLET